MAEEFVEHLKKPHAWLRILFMAGFVVALYVSGMILIVLMLAQIVFSLLTGDDNANLRRLGASLSAYVAEILAFLTYNTQAKPFPFMPFPVGGSPVSPDADPQDLDPQTPDVPYADAVQPSDVVESESPTAVKKRTSTRRKKPVATDEQETDA